MQTRKLGNSDLNITGVGFGAWAIGGGGWEFGWGKQEVSDSLAEIKRSLELGVNWIDTAAVYGLGHSEEIVAKAVKQWGGPRPYIFTKCIMVWDEQRKVRKEFSPESIRRECEGSLRRLQADTIDLYQMHWPPLTTYWALKKPGKRLRRYKRKAKCDGLAFQISTWSN
jgi:aryl-alcohol dehydrogenase-like predicted oxidoreductase